MDEETKNLNELSSNQSIVINYSNDEQNINFNDSNLNSSDIYENAAVSNIGSYNANTDIFSKTDILNFGIIFCKECSNFFAIKILNSLDLVLKCECTKLKNVSILDYNEEYQKIKNKPETYTLSCLKHHDKNIHKFIYYCTDCKFDLCEECNIEESDTYSNTEISNKKHENHTKIKLDEIISKFEDFEKLIIKSKNIIKTKNFTEECIIKFNLIFDMIERIKDEYKFYQCYSLYYSIDRGIKFFEKICNDDFFIEKSEEITISRRITKKENLDKIGYFSDKIDKIIIRYQEIELIELSEFNDKNLEILKELSLVGDKIDDISPLFSEKFKFEALKKLDLAKNAIDSNSAISLLTKKKCLS